MQEAPTTHEPAIWEQLAERLDPGSMCPRLRDGIEAFPTAGANGARFVVLRSPDGTAFPRLPTWQYEAVQSMDGTQSMRDLVGRHYEQEGVLDLAGMSSLVADLRDGGFLVESGMDCYALLRQRLPARRGASAGRVVARLTQRWRPTALQRLLLGTCALLGLVFRPTFARWLVLALAVLGVVAPLYVANTIGHAASDPSAGLALAILVVVWLGGLLHDVAGGAAGTALGRSPRRAGLRLCCGIPICWIDPREAIAVGPKGARHAWLAGPVSLLAAATLLCLLEPKSYDASVLSLCLLIMGAIAIAPFRAMTWNDLAAHAWSRSGSPGMSYGSGQAALPFGRDRPSDVTSVRRAAHWLAIPAFGWVVLLLLCVAACARLELGMLPGALWRAATPIQAAVLVAAVSYVTVCAVLQFGVPAIQRFSPSGQPLATLRRRFVPRQARGRAAAMRLCDVVQSLTPAQITALAEAAVEVWFPSGMDVVVQGEVGDEFYIVIDGVADVIDEGGPVVLRQLRRGDSFGKYAMLYRALRAATVRAVTDMRLLRVDRPTFEAYLAPRLILEERLKALAEEREFLAAVPVLAPLGQSAIDLLLPRLVKERYEPGEVIIRQGDRGDRFYMIRGGTAEVMDESATPPRRLAVLSNGGYFGEIALLLDRPRVATVRALVEVTVWSLSRSDFDLVLGRYFDLTDTFAGAGRKRLEMNRALSA